MYRNIATTLLLIAAIASGACQNQTPEPFTVHAELMASTDPEPAVEMPAKKAWNVSIGNQAVNAYYDQAEFGLSYCGEIYVEIDGEQRRPIEANVFQLEKGVWVGMVKGSATDYVKIWTQTGTTNVYLDGEFRVFTRK